MPAAVIDSCPCNLKAEENMTGAGEDSSEEERMNSLWDVLGLNPHTVKVFSGWLYAYSHFLLLF